METNSNKENGLVSLPHNPFSLFINKIVLFMNHIATWVWPLLILVIIINVSMRYLLSDGRIELEELQWHLYAIGWLTGLSFCYIKNEHVRVDFFYDKFSLRVKCWVELLGTCLLLIPFIMVVLIYSIPFIEYSWLSSEKSTAPGGLPFRWFIKSFIFIAFFLLLLTTLSRLTQVFCFLFIKKEPSKNI